MVPFWEGLARGEFLLLRCEQCLGWRWPLAGCREHANKPYLQDLKWVRASGQGKVLTYTIQRVPHDPAFSVPYVYAIIELDEGPVMVSNIVHCPPEAVRIGMPVRVVLRRITKEYTLPLFEPA
ncbi:MAG: Zn-ribbon domain-containing OB-fold protein [bacterium]